MNTQQIIVLIVKQIVTQINSQLSVNYPHLKEGDFLR